MDLGSFASAFERPSGEQLHAFVTEVFCVNTPLIRTLLQGGWRSFDAHPADFAVAVDLRAPFNTWQEAHSFTTLESDDKIYELLESFCGNPLDALLFRIKVEVRTLHEYCIEQTGSGSFHFRFPISSQEKWDEGYAQPDADMVEMVTLLQNYGCLAASLTIEPLIDSETLIALISVGVFLDAFSMIRMGLFLDDDPTLWWVLIEQEAPEVVLRAAQLGSRVVPFDYFVTYDGSRLNELLNTAIEDMPAKFAVDAAQLSSAFATDPGIHWNTLIRWLWLPRNGTRPKWGPRASGGGDTSYIRFVSRTGELPDDAGTLPFLQKFWLAATEALGSRHVPRSVAARRVLLLCCLQRQHGWYFPDNVRQRIAQYVT